ncbi:hypothetical protein Tco_1564227 [Tanacetum coccineum]
MTSPPCHLAATQAPSSPPCHPMSRTQIAKLQRKQMGNNSKIALARFRIANLEQMIKDIQARHQADKESLLNAIYEHKNSQEGPSDY